MGDKQKYRIDKEQYDGAEFLLAFIHPPREIADEIIKIKDKISRDFEVFKPPIDFDLHLTIYFNLFPVVNENKVVDIMMDILKSTKKFKISANEIIIQDFGYISLKVDVPDDLMDVHIKMVEKLNPLREGLMRDKYKDKGYISQYSEKQRKYIKKYGWPNLLDLYSPHFTVCLIKEELDKRKIHEIRKILPRVKGNFMVNNICLYRQKSYEDEHELIERVKLE